jgi:hypothetical protein
MKAIILSFLMIGFGQSNNESRGLILKNNTVLLIIDKETSIAEMDIYKTELKEKYNISIDYQITSDNDGQYKTISLKVNCNDGFVGSTKITFTKKKQKIGFFRSYSVEQNTPFIIGNLPRISTLK